MQTVQTIDREVFFFINGLTKEYFWFKVFIYLGARFLIWFFIFIFIYLIYKKDYRASALMAVSLVVALAVDYLINVFYVRPRPFTTYPELTKHLNLWTDFLSFPSGHTITAFAMAASIFFSSYKKLGLILILTSLVIGFCRIAAGVHYPTDVIGGIVLGVIIAYLVFVLSRLKIFGGRISAT
jgi:undecaprenyl-diphosphatase